jgi:hypothetical protein
MEMSQEEQLALTKKYNNPEDYSQEDGYDDHPAERDYYANK